MKTFFRKSKRFLLRLYSFIQRFGLIYALKLAKNKINNKLKERIYKLKERIYISLNNKTIKKIVNTTPKPVIIYPPYHDFNLPLYQRPQQLTQVLSNNYLYLFHTNNMLDSVNKVKKLKKNLFLIPPASYSFSLHTEHREKKILFLYSHPSRQYDIPLVEKYLHENNIVIYDYLDDLNEEIFGAVSQEAIERHEYVLREQRIILLVTASKLLEDVKKYRPSLTNTYFVPNAVDIDHFSKVKKKIPELDFIKGKKVIGYFGALASWVDYDLIAKLSDLGDSYHILLLGYIYDNKFKTTNLDKRKNITVLGPIKYEVLPDYAEYFDASIIPFIINETTLATSPIKLFEYMALGKPIITTDMPECRKYKSALIAKDHDEFISLIDKAFAIPKDDEYFKIMKKEAEENTWGARAEVIIEAINENIVLNRFVANRLPNSNIAYSILECEHQATKQQLGQTLAQEEAEHQATKQQLEQTLAEEQAEHQATKQRLEQTLAEEQAEYQATKQQLEQAAIFRNYVRSNFSWKLTKPVRRIPVRLIKEILYKVRRNGLQFTIKYIVKRLLHSCGIVYFLNFIKFKVFLNSQNSDKLVIVYPPFMSWNIPMFQRPNHLAAEISKKGYPFFYFTNTIYDKTQCVDSISSNLYIINDIFYRKYLASQGRKVFILHPNSQRLYDEGLIKHEISKGNIFIFDYLDHLDVFDLSHSSLFEFILKNENIIILCTAQTLLKDTLRYRSKNVIYLPNAVNPLDFIVMPRSHAEKKISKEHASIINALDKTKKIVGYFGAVAKWFDYSLLERLSKHFPNVEFFIIGQHYDDSFGSCGIDFSKCKNVHFFGLVQYKKLIYYASFFDCSIIPFVVNSITESTSPIKLFEYMKIGVPIVSSDLVECRKYKSALIAKDHDEFISLIDKAFAIPKDDEYFKIMKKEAEENTWGARAEVIIEAINENINAGR